MSSRRTVSVVVPLYNEQDNVEQLHAEIVAAMDRTSAAWEVIYVDDGSIDRTWERLMAARRSRPGQVIAVRLRRNFGQTAALAAGFQNASGEVIVTLDGDLQNDPADIPMLLGKLDEGFDVVSGWRRVRKDALVARRLPSHAANWLISRMASVPLHDHGCTLKAYRREVVEQIALYGEMHRFIPAQAFWIGARICEVVVHHRPRTRGTSKYGIGRTYRVMLDLITVRFLGAHGTKPLHAFGAMGLVFVVLGVLTVVVLAWLKYRTGVSFIQSPLLLLSALFMMLGGQSLLLGLLAEISVRTYYESQQKTIYIVREIARPDSAAVTESPAAASEPPGRGGTRAAP
ncbi:MAG: glycosyltransferase family 2 protein [Candidatus Polarisedimenticolia bacterium]